MLESCQNAQERWGGVHKLIDSWLKARHELVRAFDVLGAKPEALAVNLKPLQEFCGVLVDYVSAGHFGVYEQLTKEAEAFDDQRGLEFGAARQAHAGKQARYELTLAVIQQRAHTDSTGARR